MLSLAGLSLCQVRPMMICPPDDAFIEKEEGWAKNGNGPAWFNRERFFQMKEFREKRGFRKQPRPDCKFDEKTFIGFLEQIHTADEKDFKLGPRGPRRAPAADAPAPVAAPTKRLLARRAE